MKHSLAKSSLRGRQRSADFGKRQFRRKSCINLYGNVQQERIVKTRAAAEPNSAPTQTPRRGVFEKLTGSKVNHSVQSSVLLLLSGPVDLSNLPHPSLTGKRAGVVQP